MKQKKAANDLSNRTEIEKAIYRRSRGGVRTFCLKNIQKEKMDQKDKR